MKTLNLKWSSERLEIVPNVFLKLPNLHILIKQSSLPGKLSPQDFWWIAINVLNKDKSDTPPLFNDTDVLPSAWDKTKLFAKNFSKNSDLDDFDISLSVFPSRTNLKLRSISVTPMLVKKVITHLDLSKTSESDCITVVALKSEPELSEIIAKLFIMCLNESCFLNCWKVSFVVPLCKYIRKGLQLRTTAQLVFFLWLVKSLKN